MANIELAREVLAYIGEHPETHKQASYRCSTGMCFAGWAAQLAGGKWLVPPTHTKFDESGMICYLFLEEDDPQDHIVHLEDVPGHDQPVAAVDVDDRAVRILDITEGQSAQLFDSWNTLESLTAMIDRLEEDPGAELSDLVPEPPITLHHYVPWRS